MVKNFTQNVYNFKLNLLVKFYEKWITGINFIEKEFDSDFNIFWMIFLIFAYASSHGRQNWRTIQFELELFKNK